MNPVPINNTSWSMRNSYQNIAKKSMNKTRHNSISKQKDFSFYYLPFTKNTHERIEFDIYMYKPI